MQTAGFLRCVGDGGGSQELVTRRCGSLAFTVPSGQYVCTLDMGPGTQRSSSGAESATVALGPNSDPQIARATNAPTPWLHT